MNITNSLNTHADDELDLKIADSELKMNCHYEPLANIQLNSNFMNIEESQPLITNAFKQTTTQHNPYKVSKINN